MIPMQPLLVSSRLRLFAVKFTVAGDEQGRREGDGAMIPMQPLLISSRLGVFAVKFMVAGVEQGRREDGKEGP